MFGWLKKRTAEARPETKTPATNKQISAEEAYRRWDSMLAHEKSATSISTPAEAYVRSVWVYGAISIIAEWISRTPFIIESHGREIKDGDLYRLANRPNRYSNQDTSEKFRNAYFTELLANGAVMRVFTEIKGLVPQEMTIYPRWKFRADTAIDKNGREIVIRWHLNGTKSVTYIDKDEIYHDALYNPGHDWEGLAPLTAALGMVNNDVNVTEFINRYFKNDASPGFIFSSEDPAFDEEKAKAATKLWNDTMQGVWNAWRSVFLGHGLKGERVSAGLDAGVLASLKGLTKEEIVTGVFKVPLSIFGESKPTAGVVIGSSEAATMSQREAFLVGVIIPWSKKHDEEFNNDVAWRFGAELTGRHDFSNNPILESVRLERAKAAAELLKYGAPLNAVIRWMRLELETVPWGDEWFVQGTMVPASVLLKAGDKLLENRPQNGDSGPPKKEKDESIADYIKEVVEIAEKRLTSGLHDAEKKMMERIAGNNGHSKHQ